MNDREQLLSEEQLDFLTEMMNIGAGNAATALSQMLPSQVNIKIPAVHIAPIIQVSSILGDPSLPVTCVRMGMVGDVSGTMFFVVPEEHKVKLAHLIQRAMPGPENKGTDIDLSVLAEIGNIVAGVYLTAVHDFCKLNVYHTVPALAIDMIQSLLDEALVALSRQVQAAILIENEFIVEKERIRAFLLVIPSIESVKILVNSIGQARMAYREG